MNAPGDIPPGQANLIADALHSNFPVTPADDPDPYWVPPEQRVDDDRLDPDSVADRDGADLSGVDPEAGELIDLEAL